MILRSQFRENLEGDSPSLSNVVELSVELEFGLSSGRNLVKLDWLDCICGIDSMALDWTRVGHIVEIGRWLTNWTVVCWYCRASFTFSLGQSICYHVWVLKRHMVISYWSSYWSVDLSITCVDKITLAIMLSWSLYWFLNLLVTCGGRVAGRDKSIKIYIGYYKIKFTDTYMETLLKLQYININLDQQKSFSNIFRFKIFL